MFTRKVNDETSFLALIGNQFFFQVSHALFQVTLIWVVLDLSGSKQTTGLLASAVYLPYLIFSLPAGIFADGRSKVTILRWVCFLEAGIVLLIPLLDVTGTLTIQYMGLIAFILASVAAFYNPSRDSLIPLYLPEGKLLRGNTIIQMTIQIAFILGPVVAGYLIDLIGEIHVFLLIGLFFIFAFVTGFFMKHPSQEKDVQLQSLDIRSLTEILDALKKDPILIWLLIITVVDNLFIMGPAIVGMAILVQEVFQGSASDWALCETFLSLGMIVTSLLLIKWGKKIPLGLMLIVGIIMDGLTYIPVKWAGSIPALWGIIFFHALFAPLIVVGRTTIIQKRIPLFLQGRFFSLIAISVVGLTAISTALTGLVTEYIYVQNLFAYIGLFAAITGGIAIFYKPLRSLKNT
ncbi:MAG: MFS transporter [Candidatus Marinimicrobia bacterium]|nr:MFS transporter [Candidatus Neomarinimicrobiota bacterium]